MSRRRRTAASDSSVRASGNRRSDDELSALVLGQPLRRRSASALQQLGLKLLGLLCGQVHEFHEAGEDAALASGPASLGDGSVDVARHGVRVVDDPNEKTLVTR